MTKDEPLIEDDAPVLREDWPPRGQRVLGAKFIEGLTPEGYGDFLDEAFWVWRRHMGFHELEWPLVRFDDARLIEAQLQVRKWGGWLRYARQALQLSTSQAARVAGVRKSTYVEYEKREIEGSISLKTLAQVAKSFDLELVVGMRPIKRPSSTLWQRVESAARVRFAGMSIVPKGAARVFGLVAYNMIRSKKVRQRERLTQRPRLGSRGVTRDVQSREYT